MLPQSWIPEGNAVRCCRRLLVLAEEGLFLKSELSLGELLKLGKERVSPGGGRLAIPLACFQFSPVKVFGGFLFLLQSHLCAH